MLNLPHVFNVVNKTWFNNKLKDVDIRWYSFPKRRRILGSTTKRNGRFLILVSDTLKRYETISVTTVIHECVHVEQWGKVSPAKMHGKQFEARMRGLARKGAFTGLW